LSAVDYVLVCDLLDKTAVTRTVIRDLRPNFAKLDATHTGVAKTNNALLTLIIPPDGTFIRSAPILMDENVKFNFLIEIQLKQGANNGQVFRCELGQPTSRNDETLGEILEIPMVGMEFVAKEHYESAQDLFTTPKVRFENLINDYNQTSGAPINGTLFVFGVTTSIDLPDTDVLRQNWLPLAPTRVGQLFEDVIVRLADAPSSGGVLTDFYFDFEADPIVTRNVNVKAEEFGLNSSGVVIDPITLGQVGSEARNSFNLDNIVFKNLVIIKGDPNCGSLPGEHQRFQSEFQHAQERPIFKSATTFEIGDQSQIQFSGFPQQRFFTSKTSGNIGNTPATGRFGAVDTTNWDEDFSIDPSSPTAGAFFSPTPWTSNLTEQKANLAGGPFTTTDATDFEGFMPDWNISRFDFDRTIPDDRFQRISVKMVDERSNSPPLNITLWNGKRIIVGVDGSTDGSVTSWNSVPLFDDNGRLPDQSGLSGDLRGRIAEAVIRDIPSFSVQWRFSDKPTDDGGTPPNRRQDMINIFDESGQAKVLVWDDTATGGAGDWQTDWIVGADFAKTTGSPWHPVHEFQLVEGATGIPDQAIQATYLWKQKTGFPIFVDPVNGTGIAPASRGAWLWITFPYPRDAVGGGRGNQYGENRRFPFVDTFNMTRNHKGQVGWNRGVDSEDLGAMSSVTFKLKLGIFKSPDDTELIVGKANIPMVFWALDRNDRIYFQEFTQRVNNAYEQHTIPIGPRAPQSLYTSRIEELATFLGHILPNFDFFLQEREFTGAQFDWRFVKGMGWFMKDGYDEQGLYAAVFDSYLGQIYQSVEQAGFNIAQGIQDILNLTVTTRTTDNVVTDHTTIALDELHFDKELYALSSKTAVSVEPRVILERDETQDDYNDATAKAQAIDARKQFFPQFWFMRARGDVRLKLGLEFQVTGPRVFNPPLDLVCAEVKHIIDGDGYFMEIFGIRKFVLP